MYASRYRSYPDESGSYLGAFRNPPHRGDIHLSFRKVIISCVKSNLFYQNVLGAAAGGGFAPGLRKVGGGGIFQKCFVFLAFHDFRHVRGRLSRSEVDPAAPALLASTLAVTKPYPDESGSSLGASPNPFHRNDIHLSFRKAIISQRKSTFLANMCLALDWRGGLAAVIVLQK